MNLKVKSILSNWIKDRNNAVLLTAYLLNLFYIYFYFKKDKMPQGWDESTHLMQSLSYYYILTSPSADMLGKLLQVDTYYPPFYHFSTSILYLFFGASDVSARMINGVYLAVLVFSVYGIGKQLFNRDTGLIAALLIMLYPQLFSIQRGYLIDFALVATVALSIYLLLLTDNFKNFKYSIAFGAAFAVSLLTKWTAIFFIIGPLAYVIYQGFVSAKLNPKIKCEVCGNDINTKPIHYNGKTFCSKNCKNGFKHGKSIKKSNLYNLFFAFAVAFILAAIWYLPHGAEVYQTLKWGGEFWGSTEGDPEIYTIKSILYYIFTINLQISFLFSILFLVGLIFLIKSNTKSKLFLYLSMLIPYLAMTFLTRNKNPRYTLPMLAVVAVISVFWINDIKSRTKRTFLIAGIFVLGVLQLFVLPSFIQANSVPSISASSINAAGGKVELVPYVTFSPGTEDWKIPEILNAIDSDARANRRIQNRPVFIGVVPDLVFVNGLTYQYYSLVYGKPFRVYNGAYIGPDAFDYNFLNFDYLILKTGENSGFAYQQSVNRMYEIFERRSPGNYALVEQYHLPDNSSLSIYRNTNTG